jgi:hypothetical protein
MDDDTVFLVMHKVAPLPVLHTASLKIGPFHACLCNRFLTLFDEENCQLLSNHSLGFLNRFPSTVDDLFLMGTKPNIVVDTVLTLSAIHPVARSSIVHFAHSYFCASLCSEICIQTPNFSTKKTKLFRGRNKSWGTAVMHQRHLLGWATGRGCESVRLL